MLYTVTAPMVVVPDQAGKLHAYYDGANVAWLPGEVARHLLSLDMVEKVDQAAPAAPAPDGPPPPSPDAGDGTPKRPAQTALKADWVAYVVEAGLASKEEAEKLDKAAMFALADGD